MELFFWSIFFGIIGMGYFSYGRKAIKTIYLLSGTGLIIFPYFIDSIAITVVIGVVLIILPFAISIYMKNL